MRTHRRCRPIYRLARFLLAVAAAAFLMVPAAAAHAHGILETTDPANGSAVAALPARIGLRFDHSPIAIGSPIRVEDNTGTNQANGPAAIVDNHVTQAIKTGAPQGKYTVI